MAKITIEFDESDGARLDVAKEATSPGLAAGAADGGSAPTDSDGADGVPAFGRIDGFDGDIVDAGSAPAFLFDLMDSVDRSPQIALLEAPNAFDGGSAPDE